MQNVCVGKQFCLSCTHVIFHAILFILLLHNVPIWNRGNCVLLARFTSPVSMIHTGQYLCTKRAFFSVDHHHDSLYIVIFLLDPSTFFHCEPVIQRSWVICIFCRQLPHLAYQPVAFILCLCKFMPFYIHGWCIEATDRDLTKTLNWQTDYPAI